MRHLFIITFISINCFIYAQQLDSTNIEQKNDSIVYKALTDIYQADGSKIFWMGKNYRIEWNTKVHYPVFNIASTKGGLSILKKGGGQQTTSVRLADKKGKQYVLRSVNKNVTKALNHIMRGTFVQDIVQDGISASHPFAALTVPTLANAIGVFHTNPKLYWIPDDPQLGEYRTVLSNNVFLFEERPDEDCSQIASFGYSENVRGTPKTLEKIQNDHDHIIDQKAVLRARLFDMLINDWDRHDDQWRWATFKKDGTTIYKPIPRDRDQVFFVNEGLLMWIISRDFLMPKFQGFDHKIRNVKGLGFNARYFDRSFLNEPDLDDWIEEAKFIKQHITPEIIDEAIREMPPEICAISGEEIKSKLLSRLNDLPKYAKQYYQYLSEAVDVVGTNKRDYFKVNHLENGDMKVEVYKLSSKKGETKELKYQRLFKYGETKEVRLYGLANKDRFDISGNSDKGIKLHMIGGKGEDCFNDDSQISGCSKKNIIYDRSDKQNEFNIGKESRLKLSKDTLNNYYDRKLYKYNRNIPLASIGYNIDDGLILGGGMYFKRYHFRDSTFQRITANYAYRTTAFALKYSGLFSAISKTYNLKVDGEISVPRNVDNFFGLGNDSQKLTDDKSYYRVRSKLIDVSSSLERKVGKKSKWSFGAFYKYVEIRDTANRFISTLYPDVLSSNQLSPKHFSGISTTFDYDNRNNPINPSKGSRWITQLKFYRDFSNANHFIKLKSDFSFYTSINKDPRYVLALRFGGASNFCDYDFYHANYLGGKNYLRGYRSYRFGGDHYLYQNTEFRITLKNIRNYYFVGQWGLLFFHDIGRVWLKDEKSIKWHNGYGLGAWVNPFNATIVNLTFNSSSEENILVLNISFLF